MIKKIKLEIKLPEGCKVNSSMGSILHGVLMELVTPNFAEKMHQVGLRPYSQYVYYDRDSHKAYWIITALNDNTCSQLLEPILQLDKPIELSQKGYELEIVEKNIVKETSFEAIADKAFLAEQKNNWAELEFLTGAGFKSDGEYVFFPMLSFIFQNLYKRWDTFTDGIHLDDYDTLQHLIKNGAIYRYNLQMRQFFIGQGRIPSFNGSMEVRLFGNDTLKSIAAMLLEFSNYAGIGIKTALGMGGIKTVLSERRREINHE